MVFAARTWWLIPVVCCVALACTCQRDAPGGAGAVPSASAVRSTPQPVVPSSPGFPSLVVPADNPLTPDKARLGVQLFFDKRLSADGKLACVDCHWHVTSERQPPPALENIGAPPAALSPGKRAHERKVPALWNLGYARSFFWDGRASTLERAVDTEWREALGIDDMAVAARLAELQRAPGYVAAFRRVFPADGLSRRSLVAALASALRTFVCAETAFDRAQRGDGGAMTGQQALGWQLFQGAGGCTACHALPLFSDMNLPVAVFHRSAASGREVLGRVLDPGRSDVTHASPDAGGFRTPSLRDAARTGPYFHDGSGPTLDAAVILMAQRGVGATAEPGTTAASSTEPKVAHPRGMTSEAGAASASRGLAPHQMQSLIEFMAALTCAPTVPRPALPPAAQVATPAGAGSSPDRAPPP